MHTEAASQAVQECIKLLTKLPPEQCIMTAFTVTGMIVGGLVVSHDLPDRDAKDILNLGHKAMLEVVEQVRGQLTNV